MTSGDNTDTHPFEDEDDEGGHHGGVLAVVVGVRVGGVGGVVVGPGGPGAEHDDGAPDHGREVHDGHDGGGGAVHRHRELLAAVNLAVPLGALLVHLGPAIDCCN